jgi:hypothetical protein
VALAYAAAGDEAEAVRWRTKFRDLRALKNRIDGCKLRLRAEPTNAEATLGVARGYTEAGATRDAARWYARYAALRDAAPAGLLEYAALAESLGRRRDRRDPAGRAPRADVGGARREPRRIVARSAQNVRVTMFESTTDDPVRYAERSCHVHGNVCTNVPAGKLNAYWPTESDMPTVGGSG